MGLLLETGIALLGMRGRQCGGRFFLMVLQILLDGLVAQHEAEASGRVGIDGCLQFELVERH